MGHSHGGCARARRHAGCRAPIAFRTATAAINRGKPRHAAALSEFIAVILNGLQRSVNRKVQGSNPWSGAKSEYEISLAQGWVVAKCSNRTAAVQQRHVKIGCKDMPCRSQSDQLSSFQPRSLAARNRKAAATRTSLRNKFLSARK